MGSMEGEAHCSCLVKSAELSGTAALEAISGLNLYFYSSCESDSSDSYQSW